MGWKQTEYIQFTGHIDGFTQKAVRFKSEHWDDYVWVPRITRNGDDIHRIISHDHDTGEAVIEIAKWIVEKNGWDY